MSGQYPPGSEGWRDALDYPPETRADVSENRRRYLKEAKKFRKESDAWEEGRIVGVFESQLSDGGSTSKQSKEPTPEDVRLAKERAEFKEMMQAKREAKQVARAADEKAEFREFMREWIATKWDGETPDHLKKALRTGDPKDLGMLISEWHSYGGRKNNHASDATLTRYLDFPPADQSPVVDTPPAGFVYFVRNEDLFKIGITENMLRRLKQLAPDELLNVVRCSNFQEVERELHRRFKDVRLPQTEYFRLSDQQVQEVHQLMVKLAEFQS